MTPCWLWKKRPQKCDEMPVFWREMQPGYLFLLFNLKTLPMRYTRDSYIVQTTS